MKTFIFLQLIFFSSIQSAQEQIQKPNNNFELNFCLLKKQTIDFIKNKLIKNLDNDYDVMNQMIELIEDNKFKEVITKFKELKVKNNHNNFDLVIDKLKQIIKLLDENLSNHIENTHPRSIKITIDLMLQKLKKYLVCKPNNKESMFNSQDYFNYAYYLLSKCKKDLNHLKYFIKFKFESNSIEEDKNSIKKLLEKEDKITFPTDVSNIINSYLELNKWIESSRTHAFCKFERESFIFISPQGKIAVIDQNIVKILESEKTTDLLSLRDTVEVLIFSPDGNYLVAGAGDEIAICEMDTYKMIHYSILNSWVKENYISWSPDSSKIAYRDYKSMIHIRNVELNRDTVICNEYEHEITALAFVSDYKLAFASGKDILIYDLRDKEIMHRLTGHTDTVYSIEVLPQPKRIVSQSKKERIIWSQGYE